MVWLLALVAAGVGALAVPVDFSFEGVLGGVSRARIGWLWGLVGADLGGRPPRPRAPVRAPRPRRPFRSLGKLLALARSPGFLSGLIRSGRRCLAAFEIGALHARMTLGLDDPADTGLVFGFVEAVRAALGVRRNLWLELLPDYLEPGLRGQAAGRLRVVPLRLVFEALRLMLAPATVRALVAAARA
ncbi:MAG: DUF2953 domain-containing protein [Solirubrobacterales bacterium]